MTTQQTTSKLKMPTIFISHGGGPWPWMDWGGRDPYAGLARYLREIPAALPAAPKAILVVSAHWEAEVFSVMTGAKPAMLYDYYGFPEATYSVKYPAPGAPGLAARVQQLLQEAGHETRADSERGFDHGLFVPMALSFPEASLPVTQLSLKQTYSPEEHLAIGRALRPLREEGVLIIGSGLSYHNLREFGHPRAIPASQTFDTWLSAAVLAADRDRQLSAWSQAPAARQAHPREDHLMPLLVAAGAGGEDQARKVYCDEMFGVAVSGFQFG